MKFTALINAHVNYLNNFVTDTPSRSVDSRLCISLIPDQESCFTGTKGKYCSITTVCILVMKITFLKFSYTCNFLLLFLLSDNCLCV